MSPGVHGEGHPVLVISHQIQHYCEKGWNEEKMVVLVQSQVRIQKTRQNHSQQWSQADTKGTSYYKGKVPPIHCLLQWRNPLVYHNFNITNLHLKGNQLVIDHRLQTTTSEDADFSLKDVLLRKHSYCNLYRYLFLLNVITFCYIKQSGIQNVFNLMRNGTGWIFSTTLKDFWVIGLQGSISTYGSTERKKMCPGNQERQHLEQLSLILTQHS